MLVLLPPSEGKAPTDHRRRSAPVRLEALSFPELTAARTRVLAALTDASRGPDALDRLRVGPSLAGEVERNLRLLDAPALPASELYTGVLYSALGLTALPSAARRRASTRLVVVSALWGALRPGDRVPPYRLSMDADLPGMPSLAAFWRRALTPVLEHATRGRLVVDCRSTTYAAAWRSSAAVPVRVVQDRGGRRTAVSHMAKHTRGLVARHLLTRGGRDPRTPEQLAGAVEELLQCELRRGRHGGAVALEVVAPQ